MDMTSTAEKPAVPSAFEKRATAEWSRLAKEPVTVEVISGTAYALGSELATLRLFKAFSKSEDVSQGYSENLKSFYFSKPMRFSSGA